MVSVLRRVAPALLSALAPGLGAQSLVFADMHEVTIPDLGPGASAAATGDFDGDGDLDVVLCGTSTPVPPQGAFLENQGRGLFNDASWRLPMSLQGYVVRLAVGDVDGDGDLDLVAGVNRGKDLLLRNDGTGVFVDDTQGNLDVDGVATMDVALADLDGDGDLDLLIGSQYSASAFSRIALNDGTGRFVDPPNPRLPDYARAFTPFDADGDGDLDVAMLAQDPSGQQVTPRLMSNDGAGRLTDVTAGRLPSGIVYLGGMRAADVDADGDLDLLLAERHRGTAGGNGVLVWINDGTGRFTDQSAARVPQLSDNFVDVLPTDLDADGDLDLILPAETPRAGAGDGDDRILINDGTGTFTDRTTQLGFEDMVVPPGPGLTADFDQDGDEDLLLTCGIGYPRYYLNLGGGRLRLANARPLPEDIAEDLLVVTGDIDGDGDLDAITTAPETNRLLRNDGYGRLVDDTDGNLPYYNAYVTAAALVDVENDGDLDLVTSGDFLYLNDGTGRFVDATAGRLPQTSAFATRGIATGDVDGDGDTDLLLAKNHGIRRLLRNDGTGRFVDDSQTALGPQSATHLWCVELGDLDGDGDLDAVFGLYATTTKSGGIPELWFNDGTGSFTRVQSAIRAVQRNTTDLLLVDVDSDGDLDLFQAALAWCQNPAPDDSRLYLNDGAGRFTDATSTHLPSIAEETLGVTAGDVNLDGHPDIVMSIAVAIMGCGGIVPQDRVLINDGTGRFNDATVSYLPSESRLGQDVELADFDGDGDDDLFVVNGPHGTGSAEFARDVLYQNRYVQLDTPSLVQTGSPYVLELYAVRAPQPSGITALPILSPAAANVPLGSLGVLRVDAALGAVLPSVALTPRGTGRTTMTVPSSTSLVGATIHAQALMVVGSNPSDWRLTNPVRDLIQ